MLHVVAEQVEEVHGHAHAGYLFWLRQRGDGGRAGLEQHHVGERLGAIAPVKERRAGGPSAFDSELGVALPDHHDAIGVRVGEAAQ